MKIVLTLLILVAGILFYSKYLKPVPPPPPPPPPLELPPENVLTPEEEERVLKATKDSDAGVRLEAARVLAKLNNPDAESVLMEMLHKDIDNGVRRTIVEQAGAKRGPMGTRIALEGLKDRDPEVRVVSLQVLGRLGDTATAGEVSLLVKDMDERVRLEALRTVNTLQEARLREIAEKKARYEQMLQQQQQAQQQQNQPETPE